MPIKNLLGKLIILVLIVFSSRSYAQVISTNFSDPDLYYGGQFYDVIHDDAYFYAVGRAFMPEDFQPFLSKIDTNGNLLWSVPFDGERYISVFVNQIRMNLIQDSLFIYLQYSEGGLYNNVVKISKLSGNVLWNKNLTINRNIIDKLKFFNDSTLVTFVNRSSTGCNSLFFIDKYNGRITDSLDCFPYGTEPQHYVFDSKKDIYYMNRDDLYKMTYPNYDSGLFIRSYDSDISQFSQLFIDNEDSLYMSARNDNEEGSIFSLNKTNGNILWTATSTSGWSTPPIIYDNDSTLLAHLYSIDRRGMYAYSVSKSNGSIVWERLLNSYPLVGFTDGALIDESGNFVISGESERTMGVVKLNANNGQLVFANTFFKGDSLIIHPNFSGNYGYISKTEPVEHNNQLYVFGNLISTNTANQIELSPCIVKINPQSGKKVFVKEISKGMRMPSRIVSVKETDNGTYVLKQLGMKARVEKLNTQNQLVWEKTFDQGSILIADDICVKNQNEVQVVFHSESIRPSAFSLTMKSTYNDTLYFFKLNAQNGQVTDEFTTNYQGHPLELYQILCKGPESLITEGQSLDLYKEENGQLQYQNNPNGFFRRHISRSKLGGRLFAEYDDRLYFAPDRGDVGVFDKTTFQYSWVYQESIFDETQDIVGLSNGDIIYLSENGFDGNEYAIRIEPATGRKIWQVAISNSISSLKMKVDDNETYLYALTAGYGTSLLVTKVRISDGQIIWQYARSKGFLNPYPLVADIQPLSDGLILGHYLLDSLENSNQLYFELIALRDSARDVNNFLAKGKVWQTVSSFHSEPQVILEEAHSLLFASHNLESDENEKSGVSFSADTSLLWTTSISELGHITNKLIIYPNPAKGVLHVHINKDDVIDSYSIYNLKGQHIVKQMPYNQNNRIKIDFPSGVYIIEIQGDSGIYRSKFIIE